LNSLFDALPEELIQPLLNLKSFLFENKPELHGDAISDCFEAWLLDDEQKQILSLNPWDIYFLYASSYLFEVTASACCETGISKSGNFDSGSAQKHSSDSVISLIETFGFDREQAIITALICSSAKITDHGSDFLNEIEPVEYKRSYINIGLITSALRLSMELDLEHPIISGQIFTVPNNVTEDSNADGKMQFKKAFKVSFVGPHAFLPGTIRVEISCQDPVVHRALKHHENKVQRLLHYANSQVSPRYLFSDIIFEINAKGYTPLDMKYSVDSMAALKLLTGNRLYTDKRVFLRELVQNAVDACNLKKLFSPDFEPEISIDFEGGNRIIKICDNGIGMDRQWIEKYFLKIGISFYQSGDMKNMRQDQVDFSFISKFGIGFLSSFMVADKIVVRTRKQGAPGLLITISNLQDYFDVRLASKDVSTGTEVTLHLSEPHINFSRSMEHVIYLKTNIRYLTIPVHLKDHQGIATILGHEKLAYKNDEKNGTVFVAPLAYDDAEGYLFLKAKRNLDDIYALDSAKGGISIFQDGIFVTQTDSLLPEGARQNVIGRINLKGNDRCELSMDRNRIFWTEEQLHNAKRVIRLGMVDLTNQLIQNSQAMDPSLSIKTSVINHLAIFFDFNEIDDQMYNLLEQSIQRIVAKRFRDFIRVNFAHTGVNSSVPDADGYAENWQQSILKTFAKKGRPPIAG